MAKMLRIVIAFLLIFNFSFTAVNAQSKAKVKKTFRGEVLLPRTISNKAFSELFSGVFSTNLSMNFGVKNFNTGIFYNMMQCQIFPRLVGDPHSVQTVHTAGLRISYDVYPSKVKMQTTKGNFFVFSPYLCGGISEVDYSRLKNTITVTGQNTQTYSISGGANFNLMFSEYDGVGFTIGYTYINHEFNPDNLGLTYYYPNIPDKDKHGLSQYIVYGFNVHFDLAKREKESD